MRYLALSLALVACSSSTAPLSDPSSIVFVVAPNCAPGPTYHLMIDGAEVGARQMVVGDSAVFQVAPGQHAAGAVVVDGLTVSIWYPQVVDLSPRQRYIQTLNCGLTVAHRGETDGSR
jgi:hypothetical protein